jgi:hypothetical protein
LKTAAPTGYLIVLTGKHHFSELFDFFLRVLIGCTATETVQFFVVVIFYTFADCG